ncbi:MAG: hypothetical protein KDC98_09490, partial [Planctomycetes bacterium]|nr:hypothetical protein [Planctomycetota bacterium]
MTARLIRNAALAGLIACAPSCTSFEIEGSGDLDKTPDAQSVTATIHGSFWGFKWVEPEVTVCKKNHELYRIEYHHNVLYVLATVATLGLYVP